MDLKTTILGGLALAAAGAGFVVGAPVLAVAGIAVTGYTAAKYFTNKTSQEIEKTKQEQEDTTQIKLLGGADEALRAGATATKLDDFNVMLKKFFPYILIGLAIFLVVMFFRRSK